LWEQKTTAAWETGRKKEKSSLELGAAEECRASTSSFYWLCSLEAKPRERLKEQCFFFRAICFPLVPTVYID
jgi:hypothetical protein